nr:reverse transcriptase domain-containing protein [Tanacetum cinerariifolium]
MYSESRTMSTKKHEKRHRSRHSRSPRPTPSVISIIRRDRLRSPRKKSGERERGVFKRLGSRGKSVSASSDSYSQLSHSRYTEALSESKDSGDGHWKSRSRRKNSIGEEDDLSQPWVCEEIDPFTPRIRYFDFPKTRMPIHIKTYDGSEDPNKCIKDPIEIHNIKQRDGESMKDFVRRYKLESRDVKGALECMRIFGFIHGITTPELIKRLHEKIPKTVDEMMRVTTSFLKGGRSGTLESRAEEIIFTMEIARGNPFPTLGEDEGTGGPMIIEAKIGGHCIHRMYVDGGSASEILYEHCFSRLRLEIKNQLVPATTPLIGFNEEVRNKLCDLLQRNLDIFAWMPADMTAVPRHIVEHHLNVREGCSPVRQKKRGQAADRNQTIQEEVWKLIKVGIMKEVHYHDWLSNPMMAEKWRSNLPTSGRQSILQTDWQKSQSKSDFHWTAEAEEAFKQMKQLIAELSWLAAPIEKEELIVYLAAAKETPVKRSENKLHINGKISVVLGTCQPRVSVKGHILADFIVKRLEEDSLDTLMEVEEELPKP